MVFVFFFFDLFSYGFAIINKKKEEERKDVALTTKRTTFSLIIITADYEHGPMMAPVIFSYHDLPVAIYLLRIWW